jgi:hypothetical protein
MIRRIFVTIVVAAAYLFLSLQKSPHIAVISEVSAKAHVHAASVRSRGATRISPQPLGPPHPALEIESIVPQGAAEYVESDHAWTLEAKVIQLKEVSIYGREGTIARIQYMWNGRPQYAWAAVQIDDYYFFEQNVELRVGQSIVLEAAGEYTASEGVDWNLCLSSDVYCEYAGFVEGGFPLSVDYNGLSVCPSNVLIYSGYMPDDWVNGMLAWRIKVANSD